MQTLQQLQAGELIGIKRLKISEGLTQFPTEIFELADTLEILDLSGNQLNSLPNNFGCLTHLKILFLSDNNFTILPEVLAKCTQLDIIGFKANQIHYISENSFPPNLRWLILTNNALKVLPKSIGKCSRMQKLMLAGNQLSDLPSELAQCQNLALLRISANQLTHLPEWLLTMPNLSWLAFSGNVFNANPQNLHQLEAFDWQDFTIQEVLGEGASGLISKAQWLTHHNNMVAIKVFKGEVTSDGLPSDEMNACIQAGNHPHLVQILGKIKQHPQQKQALVIALIPAVFKNLGNPPSFETCTRDTYPSHALLSVEDTAKIIVGMAKAGAHLHERGLNHGDFYAHNIMVSPAYHSLLGDFGAATIYDRQSKFAVQIEQLEVRAFGCLIEDLLTLTVDNVLTNDIIRAFSNLKDDCLNSETIKRPTFSTICGQLERILDL